MINAAVAKSRKIRAGRTDIMKLRRETRKQRSDKTGKPGKQKNKTLIK